MQDYQLTDPDFRTFIDTGFFPDTKDSKKVIEPDDTTPARFIHIIRAPRDVLLSGMRYHRIAPLGNEKFLREKRDEWAGKNYRDHLNALPNDHARLLFEMNDKHDKTVQEMLERAIGNIICQALFKKHLAINELIPPLA